MIATELFVAYKKALEGNVSLMGEEFAEVLKRLSELPLSEAKRLLEEAYPLLVRKYGTFAAVAALEFYEEVRYEAEVMEAYEASAFLPDDGALLKDDVKRIAQGADLEKIVNALQSTATERVMSYADETVQENAAIDPARPKWALVPNPGACGWCVMIGSNGFMYSDEGKVENTRHPKCKCTPVVDFDSRNPKLEGYDPDALYRRYKDARDAVKAKAEREWRDMPESERERYKRKGKSSYDVYLRNKTISEMNARDRGWLSEGKPAEVTYLKPREDLTPYERKGIDALSRQGVPTTVNEEDPSAQANIDLTTHYGLTELKNVTNVSSSVGNQVSRTRKKWWKSGEEGPQTTIFTMFDAVDSEEDIIEALRERRRGNEVFYVIGEKGILTSI